MNMIFPQTVFLNLNVWMIILDLKQMFFNKLLYIPFYDSLPIFWYPNNMILMVVRTVCAVSYLHTPFYHLLLIFPAFGWNAFTHGLTPVVLSVSFDRRYASPTAHFLFHGVAWPFKEGQSFNRKQLQEFISAMKQNEEDIAKIITGRTRISSEEVLYMFDQGTSKGLDFAIEKGIVHEISEAFVPIGHQHIACNFR